MRKKTLLFAMFAITLLVASCGKENENNDEKKVSVPAISKATGFVGGHGYVDLGLPSGTLWATCNVGATTPEQAGCGFTWGATESRPETFNNGNFYMYAMGYHKTEELIATGIVDENYNLTTEYDAATANWGKDWRMPTIDEAMELSNLPCWGIAEWDGKSDKYTRQGFMVQGTNGNTLFFPAGCVETGASWYWLSTSRAPVYDACVMYCPGLYETGINHLEFENDNQWCGRMVRPVLKSKK